MTRWGPAFQFYATDFLGDPHVIAMTMEERGAYITLLCIAWEEGGIPSDPKLLRRLLGHMSARKFAAIWEAIEPCWDRLGDKWIQPRMEKVREEQIAWREKSAAGGRKSGEARRRRAKQA